VNVTPFYDDGQVSLFCADFRAVDVAVGSVAAVVTSPPYNVGLDYDATGDALAWPEYWSLAADAAGVMARALVEGGRVWVNTAVSVPADPHTGGRIPVAAGRPG
jgi:DNA modification methylase